MTKPNLVLHIGTEKTGTTHLQEFVKLNRHRFKKFGILLTSDRSEDRSTYFAATPNRARTHGTVILQTAEQRETYFANYWAEIESLSTSGADTVFISTERLSRLPAKVAEPFYKKLASYFNKVTVLTYIRRPDDMASSFYFLSIKTGSTRLPDKSFIEKYASSFDAVEVIDTWAEKIHPDTFIARPYLAAFKKDSFAVPRQVLEVLGIPEDELAKDKWDHPESELNVRTSAESTEYLRRINPLAPRISQDGTWNTQRKRLLELVAERFPGDSVRVPESTMIELLEMFPPSEVRDEAVRLTSPQWNTDQFKADWQVWLEAPRAKSGEVPNVTDQDVEALVDELFGKPKLFGRKKPFSVGGESRPTWRRQLSKARAKVTRPIRKRKDKKNKSND